jgi:hypothetical protein
MFVIAAFKVMGVKIAKHKIHDHPFKMASVAKNRNFSN